MVYKSTPRAQLKCYLLKKALPDCSRPTNIRLGPITKSTTLYSNC